ncbi:uncharacterized protein LJ206_010748 isoform 1-T2 [Theristicus caerulescens]
MQPEEMIRMSADCLSHCGSWFWLMPPVISSSSSFIRLFKPFGGKAFLASIDACQPKKPDATKGRNQKRGRPDLPRWSAVSPPPAVMKTGRDLQNQYCVSQRFHRSSTHFSNQGPASASEAFSSYTESKILCQKHYVLWRKTSIYLALYLLYNKERS